jgi:hypothetical protein
MALFNNKGNVGNTGNAQSANGDGNVQVIINKGVTRQGDERQLIAYAIKSFLEIHNSKYKVEAVKYVSDMYEMQQMSKVELRKLNVQSEMNRLQEKNITLYIEKSFQYKTDEMTKEHLYKMKKLEIDSETILHNIDAYAKIELKNIDSRYSAIILENERQCAMYRCTLQDMLNRNITPATIIAQASELYLKLTEIAFINNNAHTQSSQATFSGLLNFIESFGKQKPFITFSEFINEKNRKE